MDFVDRADSGQIWVLELLQKFACSRIHEIHRVQGQASKIFTDVPDGMKQSSSRVKCDSPMRSCGAKSQSQS